MKTKLEIIGEKPAQEIVAKNNEYLLWLDGSEITSTELQKHFKVVQYDDKSFNLEHKSEDFRIENIIFSENM